MGPIITQIVTVLGSVTVIVLLVENPRIVVGAFDLVRGTITGLMNAAFPGKGAGVGGRATV